MLVRALLCACALGLSAGDTQKPTCGYRGCVSAARAPTLNVHVVAHSHDDLGWLRTLDQYYNESVRDILDSVVKALYEHPHRRFVYAETAYLWRWWGEQDDSSRARMRALVRDGRLALAGGGWAVNDEATTHYQGLIDQITLGIGKLVSMFGSCGLPAVGWQADPFGHARAHAALLSAAGCDGLLLGRVDFRDHRHRQYARQLEMLWRGDDTAGAASDIFTSILYDKYNFPEGLCFECGHELTDWKVSNFIRYATKVSEHYATNNILIPFGGDFAYKDASKNFDNIDKLIERANAMAAKQGVNMTVFYSTPACYIEAVRDAAPTLPIKQDDFLPYASHPGAYWVGLYTSRPALKYLERDSNNLLQVVKQLQVLAGLDNSTLDAIEELKAAMGVMQHHDAVTGTARQLVAQDYVRMLHEAIHRALRVPQKAFNKMMLDNSALLQFEGCHFNESRCKISETSAQFVVAVYNPLAWHVREPIRIPVVDASYTVYAPDGKMIVSQIVEMPQQVLNIRKSMATHEIVFIAYLKPLMLKTFFVKKNLVNEYGGEIIKASNEKKHNLENITPNPIIETNDTCKHCIRNEHITLNIDNTTGEITDAILADGTVTKLNIRFSYYAASSLGGAYIFATRLTEPRHIPTNTTLGARGSVVQELMICSNNVSSVVRIYDGLNFIEHEWIVGPIDVSDEINSTGNIDGESGKEIIVRYVTDLANNAQFYTDSNGRQMLKRILNRRPQWNWTVDEPVTGNYYPVTNRIFIEDENRRVSILTDRSEGGTSLEKGQIELLLHRRVLNDDGCGLLQALNETVDGRGLIVRGRHRIFLTGLGSWEDKLEERKQVFQMHLKPHVFIADARNLQIKEGLEPFEKWMSLQRAQYFANELPEGVHLLTLEPWGESRMLLRLENFRENSNNRSDFVLVDLDKIFKHIQVLSFEATNIVGHQLNKERKEWTWKTNEKFYKNFNEAYGNEKTAAYESFAEPAKGVPDNGTQVVKQLQVLAGLDNSTLDAIEELKAAMGVMQHHDAVTGTARQLVAQDYVRMLHEAIHRALRVPQKAFNKMMLDNSALLQFEGCHFNESRCKISETSAQFVVAVYNPLAWHVREPIRIPVVDASYTVYAPDGKMIVSQIVEMPQQVLNIRKSMATHEIVFIAYLKPLMLKTFFVKKNLVNEYGGEIIKASNEKKHNLENITPNPIIETNDTCKHCIRNEHITLNIDNTTGEITDAILADGTVTKLNIRFSYYAASSLGGAYIFATRLTEPRHIPTNTTLGARGSVVQELMIGSNNVSSVVRIYDGLNFIEHEWIVGPIDVNDEINSTGDIDGESGKEIIVRYVTDLANNAQFYTDSNGRQMLKRILNRRPQWNWTVDEPVTGNYYPVTNRIFIEDENRRVSILTDRSEGGTSLEKGQIELLLHRRVLNDDGCGLLEALNETVDGRGIIVRGRHRIFLTGLGSWEDKLEERKQVFQMHLKPHVFIADARNLQITEGLEPFEKWMFLQRAQYFANELPEGVHLLTLEPWGESRMLLRLENFRENSNNRSDFVLVDLDKIFKHIQVLSFEATNIVGHQLNKERKKWTWKTNEKFYKNFNEAYGNEKTAAYESFAEPAKGVPDNGTQVALTASQIRTFIVSYKIRVHEE